jgi:hypothetical protein
MKAVLLVFGFVLIILSCNDDKAGKITNETSVEVQQMSSPASDSCAEPFLFTDRNEKTYLSWIEKKGKQSTLYFSTLLNEKWSEPQEIASGNNWFVNWADYPVISSDGVGNLLAHFLEKSDTAKFTYDVKMVSSADSGKTWSQSKILNEDNVKAEHGFVSIIPYKDGFFTAWLDGRKTGTQGGERGHGHHGEMTLRGAMLDMSGNKINEWELDARICDCCQTSVAIANDGPVVVYRDRSEDEVRDMSIVRYINGQWLAPKRIHGDNWQVKACPVNGPRISAIGNNLAVAWFSVKDKKGEVKLIFSNDGGKTFNKSIRIDEGNTIGRVGVVMIDTSTAMVSWMEGGSIKAAKVHAEGTKENSILIASSSDKRSSGFPQMTKSGNRLIFAWTDDKEKTVKVGIVKL